MRMIPTALSCALILNATLVAAPASAQYVFLDVNGDGVCNANDVVTSAVTSVDIYFDTDHNGNGSVATCPDGTSQLTISSYEFILHLSGTGVVTWGAWTNSIAQFTVDLGTSSNSSDFRAGFGGATSLPPGKYKVGSLAVSALGTPSLYFQAQTTLNSAYMTAFGSQCPGRDMDNVMKLGPNPAGVTGPGDFQSVCGTAPIDPVKYTTWGVIKNKYR